MQKTTLIVLFSFFNLFFLRATNKPETNAFDANFEVTVSLIGEVTVDYKDYNFTATYEWQFEYGPIGFKTGQGKTITVSGWPYYNFKLDPLKGYDFRVRENRLVNNALVWTDWSQTKTIFASSDKVFSVGYTTNFDDEKETNLEWRGRLYSNSTSDAGIGFSTQVNHSPSAEAGLSVYMSNYNYQTNSYIGFVSPKFNDLATDRKIKFWTYGYTSDTELLVGTMTDPNDFNTFHLLNPVEVKAGGGWQQQTIYFNNYKGTDQYVVFFFKRNYYSANNDVYIDDFSYEKASDCFDQSNFSVTNVQQKTADISFDAPNQNNFQVSLTNVLKHTTEIINIQSSPFTLTNLVGNTEYQVKVRANCIDDLFSNWTKTITFKTPCTVISDNYSTSFEGTNYIDPCWSVISNNLLVTSSLQDPDWPQKPAAKTGTATVLIQKFVGRSNVDKAYLITPYIADLDADKRVKFSLLSYGNSLEYNTTSLTIGTMSDPKDESTFIALKTILPSEMNELQNLNKSSAWKEHTVYLDNYVKSNNHHYIAIRDNNEGNSIFSIDDFVYEKTPSCLEPLNPRTLSYGYDFATVTWDNYKPATEWQVEYGPKGFAHGTGTVVTATSFPFKITENVLDDVEYDFYVRNKCGNDYSGWSDRGYFRTKCEGMTAGYKEDFETFAFEKIGCWTRIVPNFTKDSFYTKNDFIASVKQSVPNYLVHSGLRSIALLNKPDVLFPDEPSTAGNSDKIILISPRLKDFDHYKKISFWMSTRQQSTQAPSELIFGTMSDPEDYNTFTPYRVVAIPVESHDKMIKYEIEFSDYYGTDKFIAFKQSKANVRLTDFYIDDFEYNQNECTRPGLLGAKQSGSDTATLDWRDNNTKKPSESWDIEYGPKGFVDGSGTIINVKTNPANLTGLAQGIYDCRVRSYCEAAIASDWSDRYTFKIGCSEKAPFVENFDKYKVLNEIPGFCWTKNSFMDTQLLEYYLTNINSAPNVFYLQNNPGDALLVSPYLEDFDKDKKIKFWLNAQLNSNNIKAGDLVIGTIKNPLDVSTFEPYQTILLEELRNLPKYGKEVNIDFSEYKGSNKQIAFMFKQNDDQWSGTNRVLIDDFNYNQTLSCYEPIDVVFSNINNSSVQINWTSKNAVAEKVEIEYGVTGFTPGTGTILNTTANEIKVSNLQAGISYQFYFKTVCNSGNSILVGPKKIETTCSVKTLPWIEKFSNLPAYGKDILPDCFKLLHGSLTLENTAQEETYSNYSPDYLRDGFDDHSYIYLRGDFWTDFMAPMFHLEAGTTYKFSVQGRNSYEYRTQGIGLSAGRGQNAYNMETRLGGTGRLTEYNYSEVVSYFTPLVSGDYSFLMDFSNSGAPNLLADNFELKEAYKISVDGNKNSTVYDFQKGITDDIILEDSFDASCEIGFDDQSAANKVVVMSKASTGNMWLTAPSTSNSAKMNENSTSIWELNQSSISKINTKVDAKNAATLFMSFELKQRFADHNNESMFRVIVNGNVLGDIIKPVTKKEDSFQKYMFDLTPYVGSEIRISLQHIGKTAYEDTAYLDNLSFAKTVESLSVVENKITDFKYYPNPIENILNIESNSIISNLEVYNLNGQLLFENKYSDAKIAVDFKNYSTGVYLIVLKRDDKKETFKVIKK